MGWNRCDRNKKCDICGKTDWCGWTPDGAFRCMRTEDAPPGWRRLGRMDANGGTVFRPEGEQANEWVAPAQPKPKPKPINFSRTLEQYHDALTEELADELNEELNIGTFWTMMFEVGWSPGHKAWTFPMRNAKSTVVGVRLRTRDGKKFAVKGSQDGLFMPDIIDLDLGGQLLIAEGPSDTMALWELGFIAVGRPSCRGGMDHVCEFIGHHGAVIVSDADSPGRAGAQALADRLVKQCSSVKIIEPLIGNDVRDWVAGGATKETINCVISTAKELTSGQQVQSKSA